MTRAAGRPPAALKSRDPYQHHSARGALASTMSAIRPARSLAPREAPTRGAARRRTHPSGPHAACLPRGTAIQGSPRAPAPRGAHTRGVAFLPTSPRHCCRPHHECAPYDMPGKGAAHSSVWKTMWNGVLRASGTPRVQNAVQELRAADVGRAGQGEGKRRAAECRVDWE